MKPLIKNHISEGSNTEYRIVKAGSADRQVLQSTEAATNILGVNCQPGVTADKERIDVLMAGEGEVECGGAIAPGVSFTSDADGKAVAATTGQRAAGIVRETGATGRIVPCLVFPHTA